MSSLLDDLESAYTQHLLESGNLRKQPALSPWLGKPWISQGYLARVSMFSCTCGADHSSLLGIFHIETRARSDGAPDDRREISLDLRSQVSLDGNYPVEVSILPSVKACPACISQKGFMAF